MKKMLRNMLVCMSVALLSAGCSQKSGTGTEAETGTAAGTTAGTTAGTEAGTESVSHQGTGETIELKFAQTANAGGANGQGMEKFAELIAERTNGRYKISTFHDGQLGQETNYIEDCQMGTLDLALINMAPLSSLIADYGAMNLPYLITSTEQADAVFWGETGEYYLDELSSVGLHGLAIFETGFRDLSNSKHEVSTPDDVKGLRIRVMENEIHQEIWRTLGADPVPMSWSEAYTAMQQGAIDGQENPAQIANQLNVAEVNKYIAMTDHVYSVIPIVMSEKAWNALSEEDQKIFKDCATEASIFQRDLARKMTETAVKELESKGVEVTYPDKELFVKATQPVRDKYHEQYAEILDKIAALEF